MNDTPTPRTDAEHAQFPMGGFTLDFARQLERELTAAREESDKWEQLAHDKLSEVCRQIEKTRAVTEQRDRLAEALRGVLHGTGCCQSDKPESHPLAKYKNALIALQSLNEH